MYSAFIPLLVLLNVLDVLTTFKALKQPNTSEANPVMKWVLDRAGYKGMIAMKIASIFIVGAIHLKYGLPIAAQVLVIVIYLGVVVNNVRVVLVSARRSK